MTDTMAPDTATARIAFLRGLRAVRQLRPDALPESVLHDILEVARWSGSAGNRQPWEFVDERLLGIPAERVLRETISLGYPAEHLQPTPNPPGRKPLEQLVHWDRY